MNLPHNTSLVTGRYSHPLISQNTKNSDPWRRNYYAPPPLQPLVCRSHPLNDIRVWVSSPRYSPETSLQSHGFGIVKHHSSFVDQLDGDLAEQAIAQVYHPEIRDLVLETTKAKQVFVLSSVFRQGKRTSDDYKLPAGQKPISQAECQGQTQQGGMREIDRPERSQPHKLAGQCKLSLSTPIRVPHLDFTPLGARQTIRQQSTDILEAANQAGVIGAEDRICKAHNVSATTKDADGIIAEHYNERGLGPRYAAYSIWRPLKPVGRDPITLAPRSEVPRADGELVYWSYENKMPGPSDTHSDYLREYAMLGVRQDPQPATSDACNLKWFYLSHQSPDDVLFIKLFDSASLGKDSQHAGAPWHASPELGDAVASDEPRESIDVRVLAFW